SNSGTLLATGGLDIDTRAFNNSGFFSADDLQLKTDEYANSGQFLIKNLGLELATVLNNQGGTLEVSGLFTLKSPGVDNTDGLILAGVFSGDIVGDILNKEGKIQSNSSLDLSLSGDLHNESGFIYGKDSLALAVAGHIFNNGGDIHSEGAASISAVNFINQAGSLKFAGSAEAGSSVSFSGQLDNRSGQIRGSYYQLSAQDYLSDEDSLVYA
ncbi:MAG: hypothetical protein OIF38_12080, partial [Cellvibrionaceae bacterium]|nr:hypothetical protein [Cellvibrionaceae bacterium]